MKPGIDYIGVGVGAVIINKEGKIFLAKRGKKVRNEAGFWDFPGGGVEYGETLVKSLIREIKEEHGVDIQVIDLLNVCDHIIKKEKQHWVAPTFLCKIKKGVPKILEPKKCDEIGWFTLSEMANLPLTITARHGLEHLQKKFSGLTFLK